MRQDFTQGKARSIDNPAWVLNGSRAHSVSESEPFGLKAGISTSWGTGPDLIHIFLRSNNIK